MFDITSQIEVESRPASIGGALQKIDVRWPTDQEWSTRQRARKIIIRNLGRGVKEYVPPEPTQADIDLFQKIALNGAPELTRGEAQQLLDTLATARVISVSIEGTTATVEMETLNGLVSHQMRVPMTDQVLAWRRSASRILELPYNSQEVRTTPDAGARLYDECGGTSKDYENAIPAIHKDAVVKNVIDYIDNMLGPKKDDANF
jgi:hypothetical protein